MSDPPILESHATVRDGRVVYEAEPPPKPTRPAPDWWRNLKRRVFLGVAALVGLCVALFTLLILAPLTLLLALLGGTRPGRGGPPTGPR